MKRIALAVLLTIVAGAAMAGPLSYAEIKLDGGYAVFEFWDEDARLPGCGASTGAMTVHLRRDNGDRVPYGTGCWAVGEDGYVHTLTKSFDTGGVGKTRIHHSNVREY